MPEGADGVGEGPQAPEAAEAEGSQAPAVLATALAGGGSVVWAEVALADEPDPVVGSFTVDGMTFALAPGGVELVSASPEALPAGSEGLLEVPASVAFDGASYEVASIGAFAFYLSGAASVALPATASEVDERAFRSSDVERVEVDPESPHLASFDGCLYDSSLTRLLLIPGGRQGAVRIDSHAEVVPASAFSHCAGVTAISADAGGAAFSSWDGLLYDASGTTLLRVPAGATAIEIREGCASIAAGAMEGCARLASIEAPASVASVSVEALGIPTPVVELPANALVDGEDSPNTETSQLSAMVALVSSGEAAPALEAADISVNLADGALQAPWHEAGFQDVEGGVAEENAENAGFDESVMPVAPQMINEDVELGAEEGPVAPIAVVSSRDDKAAALTPVAGKIRLFYAEDPAASVNFMWVTQNVDGTLKYAGGNNLGSGFVYESTLLPCGFNATGFYASYRQGVSLTYLAVPVFTNSGMTGDEYVAAHQNLSDYTLYDIAYYYWSGNPTLKYDRHSTTAYESITSATYGYDFYLTPGKAKTITWNANQATVDSSKSSTSEISYVGSGRTISAPSIASSNYPAGYASYSWYSTPATSGGTYICGASGKSRTITADTTYYARWTKRASYAITLSSGSDSSTLTRYYWPDRGYTKSSSSTAVVEPGESLIDAADLPIKAGYDFAGYYSSTTSTVQYVDKNGMLTSSAPTLTAGATWYAKWTRKASYTITLDANGGSPNRTLYYWPDKGVVPAVSSTTVIEPGVGQAVSASNLPTRSGYTFKGYFDSPTGAVAFTTAGGVLATNIKWHVPTGNTIWYAQWIKNGVLTIRSAEDPGSTEAFSWVMGSGSAATGSGGGNALGCETDSLWPVERTSYGLRINNRFFLSTSSYSAAKPSLSNYTLYDVAYYVGSDGKAIEPPVGWSWDAQDGALEVYVTPGTPCKVSWNANGGTVDASTVWVGKGRSITAPIPKRAGFTCTGWWTSTTGGSKVADAGGATSAIDQSLTLYARWVENDTLTIYSAEDPESKSSFAWLMADGELAAGSAGGNSFGTSMNTLWPAEKTKFGFRLMDSYYLTPGGYTPSKPNLSDYVLYDIAYYKIAGGPAIEPVEGWKHGGKDGALEVYLTPGPACKVQWDANGGMVDTAASWVGEGRTTTSPMPLRMGFICTGWWTDPSAGTKMANAGDTTQPISQSMTLYAHWTPALSVDVPLEVTAKVDLLGIEEPTEATGWIESRSGGALQVAEVSFTPLAGAGELFGFRTADVFLEAFAEGSASADVSFALDAARKESDASKLAPFALPDGYGTRIGVGYRFAIPDDVASSLDASRFEGVTTPVGQVVYTVALAE